MATTDWAQLQPQPQPESQPEPEPVPAPAAAYSHSSKSSGGGTGVGAGVGTGVAIDMAGVQRESDFVPLPRHYLAALCQDYVDIVFPMYPIMSPSDVEVSIGAVDTDADHRSFVYALAAATMSITSAQSRHEATDVVQRIISLCRESLTVRRPLLSRDTVSVRLIMTSVFIQISLAEIQDVATAWFHLREATTMTQILRVDHVDELAQLDLPARARLQRLYWMLFIHERFLALWDYRPVSLAPLATLPERDSAVPHAIQTGFDRIIKLFRLVDSTFLDARSNSTSPLTSNPKPNPVPSLTYDWVRQKQAALGQDDDAADVYDSHDAPGSKSLSEMQHIDLIITRTWLRILLWQTAMGAGLLSRLSLDADGTPDPHPGNASMSPFFPVRLAPVLRSSLTNTSLAALESHGCCLLQKLFEIVNTIADVLVHVSVPAPASVTAAPTSPSNLAEGAEHMSHLLFLVRFLLNLCWKSPVRSQILNRRIEGLCLKFLDLQRVITENSPLPSSLVVTAAS
ncbi:hypothetical protein A1O3_01341 [Capronia epimyces CBS 606.96]|uniref:Transcription factor domain-containing protein n=1 Tax=Capronia epimyces CBS 606.96 TaxID=1182542 RepID=W9ZE40_9EURO|nr:uncharacterized protein A1O3_01341 [Capronia epimyces CBS 606.96]EXJ92789.1 hypothetical protein A1O3_01341 [Capronia epimyces CBS 606.96]